MRAEDLPAVLEIERVAYSTPWPESSFRGLLGRADTALFVAEVGGEAGSGPGSAAESDPGAGPGSGTGSGTVARIAGYAVCWAVVDQGELGNIAVAPTWRRHGVGRLLLEEVIQAMRDLGVRELFLEVRISNTGAQSLYRQYGFLEVGLRRGYYASPVEDALIMRRALEQGSGSGAEHDT